MRILLIDPPFKRFTGYVNYFFPIGISTIAQILSDAGFEVRVFDVDVVCKGSDINFSDEYRRLQLYIEGVNDDDRAVWQDIQKVLNEYQPDIIGITIMTQKFASALKVAQICKEWKSSATVIAGGPHPTIDSDQVLESKFIDFAIRGEGEVTFLELVRAIRDKADFGKVLGLSFKKDGRIVHNPDRDFIQNLDVIPFPARNLLLNPEKYSSEDMGVIMSSRGCPFNCTYCFNLWTRRVRFRSVENVISEIRLVKDKYGTRQFAFKDDTFTIKRSRLMEFCEKLIIEKLGINWECTTRVDVFDENMLRRMIQAGCNIIKIGVESGSPKILKETKKGITPEQIREAAKLLNKYNIFWSAYFMMGLPQETEEDILSTYNFMKELNPYYAGLGIYNPMPHTELFNTGVEMGLLYDKVEIEHFFRVNPKDYYFKDPKRRVVNIDPQRFAELTDFMMDEFHKHNTRFMNLARRGWARRKAYCSDPGLLFSDLRKAANWLIKT